MHAAGMPCEPPKRRVVYTMVDIMRRSPSQRAKVFWSGRSQAVRLPKEFRFAGDSVRIRREGDTVVLEPDSEWPEGWVESFAGVGDLERQPQGRATKRAKL